MKRNAIFLITGILIFSCLISKKRLKTYNELEIIKIDSTRDHFVFTAKNNLGNQQIILAEKINLRTCTPFKKYIIADSIHKTLELKSGSRDILIGHSIGTIDGVKIRDSNELIKIINNCDCFKN